jgi:hypothetical protein
MAQNPLVEFWKQLAVDKPPFIAPGDKLPNECVSIYSSPEDYIKSKSFGKHHDTDFHVGLLPIPYVGNLQNATIFLLMLNPGLSAGDYFAEYESPTYREVCIRNLRKENIQDEYPFISLDPRFAWHPGFEYWQNKLDSIVQELSKQLNLSYQDAIKHLSQKIACLELVAYHSKSFGANQIFEGLPSTKIMKEYVQRTLVPRAKAEEITIVRCTRCTKMGSFAKRSKR